MILTQTVLSIIPTIRILHISTKALIRILFRLLILPHWPLTCSNVDGVVYTHALLVVLLLSQT